MRKIILIAMLVLFLFGCGEKQIVRKTYYVYDRFSGYCYQVEEGSKDIQYQQIECDTIPDGVDYREVDRWLEGE